AIRCQPLRLCGDEPPGLMTILDRLSESAAASRRAAQATSIASALVAAVLVVTPLAMVLSGGRWLTLSAALPFVAWIAAAVAAWSVRRLVARRWRVDATSLTIAGEAEREHGLRWGSLTGLVQVAP